VSFYCFTKGHSKNHYCFSNRLLRHIIQEFDSIKDKGIVERYVKYEIQRSSNKKENVEKENESMERQTFQIRHKRQIFHAFIVRLSLHNLHVRWFFI
jgi:chromatin remodeling complex protein RSC6